MSQEDPLSQNDLPSYNPIFEKLVVNLEESSEDRLIGMLAYAEYKLDKYNFICEKPIHSQEQLQGFLSHCSSRRILTIAIRSES